MSSLPEKSQQPLTAAAVAPTTTTSSIVAPKPTTTTTFFFRSDSIRKIKCTAVYPFQVAGIKLSKNAIIELLENNIKKARVCTQKTMLNFYYVILKLLSTLFTLWDNKVPVKASIQPTPTPVDTESTCTTKNNDSKERTTEKKPSLDSYHARLEEKLAKIQKHKSRLNGDRLIPSSFRSTSATAAAPASSSTSDISNLSGSQVSSSLHAVKSVHLQSSSLLVKSKFQDYCLVLCVHAGLVVMYLQVVILGIALNTTQVPLGLIFMLVTIAIIGYIFVKVSLIDKQSATAKSPRSSPVPKAKSSSRSQDILKDDFSPERPSRSKAKKFELAIELKYKTLSKVKLL